ncbi:hypothetical protein ABW21_db0209122 [Orbilia brochopaga]|nr:hypothetical protein ABW21_db0209122 [Drechslerella brochopaga]
MDSKPRMGLTLQGYDQVIALSQGHINQTLKRSFKINKKRMAQFKAIIGTDTNEPDYALEGTIDPPTIELIDADKGDHAIYKIKFQKGAKYTYWDYWGAIDPNNKRGGHRKFEIQADGWVLAFFVRFAMERCERIPDHIKEIVMKQSPYSVDQLVVDFDTANLINFDWERSIFPNLTDKEVLLDAKTHMSEFVNQWLIRLKDAEKSQSHNILGYTVKLDVEGNASISREQLLKRIGDTPPSFPPIKVQFQTMANKLHAADKGHPADPDNAVLFTEMCGNSGDNSARPLVSVPGAPPGPRPIPQHDLQWSGQWFYGSAGGTLAMSKENFQEFVGKLIEPIHKSCTALAEPIAKRQTREADLTERLKRDFKLLDDWNHREWRQAIGEPRRGRYKWVPSIKNQWILRSSSTSNRHNEIPWHDSGRDFPWENLVRDFTVDIRVCAALTTGIKPNPGTNQFDIEQQLSVTTWGDNSSARYSFETSSTLFWNYNVQLNAVDQGGRLTATVHYSKDYRPLLYSTLWEGGFFIPSLHSNSSEEDRREWNDYEKMLLGTIEDRMSNPTDFENAISQGLNDQTKFIFPGGGGTFDISDPVFSDAGNLLLGLVYREGKL